MASPKKSASWQAMRRALSSKSKTELLNLIRDLYALRPENQDFIQAQALPPKTSQPRQASAKDLPSNTQKSSASTVAPKIRRVAQVAEELWEGESFNITRLTTIKSLCEDAKAAAQFAFHLAKLTHKAMEQKACPKHIHAEKWEYYKRVVADAIQHMTRYVDAPTGQESAMLRQLLAQLCAVQDRYEQQAWGPVRIIESTEVLMIEMALSCLLQPTASADWGYRIARQYAECYDSRYGTGLIPESAPLVEDIAEFWCQYHFRKPLQEWLGTS
jgi:hypothetical protein